MSIRGGLQLSARVKTLLAIAAKVRVRLPASAPLGYLELMWLRAVACIATISLPAAALAVEGVAVQHRIDTAFAAAGTAVADPVVTAAAWREYNARVFAAGSCLVQGPPLDCLGDAPPGSSRTVKTITIEAPSRHEAAVLDGRWQGPDYAVTIDTARDQASTDRSRPLEWQRFSLKEISDRELLFTIGPELFEAKLQPGETLLLTSTSFRGERVLSRR
jgi:hypothetical protein